MSQNQQTKTESTQDEQQLTIETVRKSVEDHEELEERLTDNVIQNIGPARYFERDEYGNPIENWNGVFKRVAENVAEAEYEHGGDQKDHEMWASRFQSVMNELRFVPNSPTLMNAGLDLQQLSACFVLEPGDSMSDESETKYDRPPISQSQTYASDIFKSGGGVGYAFHHLRPKGARVGSTGGVSSGPLSFMRVFDATCGTVKQGGKRRGAQMAIMHCQHPDIGRFAVSKRGEDTFTNFNISYGVTDEFKEAVENDEAYTLYDPTEGFASDQKAFEVVAEAAHFYDPKFEDAWNDEYDKPGIGLDGKKVEENFWRDYHDDMATDFSEWRSWFEPKTETQIVEKETEDGTEEVEEEVIVEEAPITLEPGEPMELPAGFIWQLLVDGAWNNGEPGIFNLDETNREHSFDVEKHPEHFIHATNPCCVAGDTFVHTDNGLRRIEDLCDADAPDGVLVDGRLDESDTIKESSSAYVTGRDDVYKLTTEEGYSIRVTDDHPIRTDDGWVEAQDLSPGDTIHINNRMGSFGDTGTTELGEVLGWLVGDGHLKRGEERAVLNLYGDDTEYADRFEQSVNRVVRDPRGNGNYEISSNTVARTKDHGASVTEQRIRSTRLYELAATHGLVERKLQVPDTIMQSSKDCAAGFLRALFSADGSIQGTKEKGYSVRLGTTSSRLAHDVQTLLSNFGIYSRVYEERSDSGTSELPDGRGGTKEYDTKAMHEVVISSEDLVRFESEIGFIHDRKNKKLADALDSYSRGPYPRTFEATVESFEHDGHEVVYDLTEPDTHSFVANGIVVHNSEQPLENFEACNLGHVNLSLMVDNSAPTFPEFINRGRMDFDSDEAAVKAYFSRALDHGTLKETIDIGTRFLDNVVTMSDFPLEQIDRQVGGKRKIGLGLMGFHQMLMQMGIEYGTDVSYEAAREIMRLIDMRATQYSHELAEERHVFPEWNDSKWSDPEAYPEWFEKHAHEDPSKWEDGYKMRNHNVTTIAPTGTTSMIGNTTGGCEPLYNVVFYKNVGDDIQGDKMLIEFDDYFLRMLEANGIDVDEMKDEAETKMKNNEFDSVDDLDTVPQELADLFVTTQDLTGEQHIRMQAAFQEYCDSGISKTLNMANDATIEEVGDAFMLALDLGIKGTTVYRDGSRDTQVKTTRMDNGLDSEVDGLHHLVEQLDTETAMAVVEQLDADVEAGQVEKECGECGSGKLDLSESCPVCLDCGYSPCK